MKHLGSEGIALRENKDKHVVMALLLCRCGKLYDKDLEKREKRKAKRGKTSMPSV